ncbi:tRNA pseudouridine(55) synthase TruB [Pyxidicoccus trucidator]|uniref:tRNA pseudouridine(55) synthase TruB n=1 Tax=Pyxidicoccus trucidator TaxID=2709662 RepID=UPI0013D9941F|nr:tRNA pseudouridine(55) synthase TruB [Pyxidicoccus trucidator]
MTPGIYRVHKPVGPTSFSVVQSFLEEVRAHPGKRVPVCHGGTLDPFAEGLLLVLVGGATRLFELLHSVPKTYEAEVVWGTEMDTGDLHGKPVLQGDTAALTPEALDAALARFIGWQEQVPPATSAKKVGGEPAYRKAHRGEVVELPPSRVYLHSARWLSHALPRSSRLLLTCRGGYYVRSLARDVGRVLGCGAHLSALRRTAIGPWEDPPPGQRVGLHGRELLPWSRARLLTDQEVGELRRERGLPLGAVQPPDWRLPPGFPDPDAPVRGFHQGRLTFLLREREGALWSETELRGGL